MDYVAVKQARHPAYRPLDQHTKEIRLLDVIPSVNEADSVRCDVLHKSLNSHDSHEYETISYAWGASKDRRTIVLNDVPLPVPIESERALRRMRLSDKYRTLWIDSVCINQVDGDERSQQVAIMSDIYRSSNGNLIYLGDEDGLVGPAVENMNLIYEEMRLWTNDFTVARSVLYYAEEGLQRELRHSEESLGVRLNLEAFTDLIGRPCRLWVLQEAALAPANRCYAGRHEFDLLLVLRVAAWLYIHRTSLTAELSWNTGFQNVIMLFVYADHQYGLFGKKTRKAFSDLLYASSLRQTTDPRDRVFGMLGLLGQLPDSCRDASHLLSPDYQKHVAEVQRDATRYIILEDNALNILALIDHSETSLALDACSWAVRLVKGKKGSAEPNPLLWGQFHAANGRVVDPRLVLPDTGFDDPRVLSLLGMVSDVVIETGEVLAPEVYHSAETVERALCTVEELTSRRTTLSTEDMFRVLVTDIGARREQLGARREQLTDSEAQQMAASWKSCKDSRPPGPKNLRSHIGKFAWHRRVFTTAKGALGLGPALTVAGDLITVLDGGALPFVLRPEKSSYRVVGACYVHGIMHGTDVQGGEEGEKQIFDLR
ncbi:hypothetical protein LTR97_007476 [Elasticomyces elasticus]|uniref:Heterokaryon incompatibility domain-containing protein n=1 Tax=Elasticomyces elasticus TaxID=574655 RepID=A0AAN7W8D3_9PEZI|nr:hypothetical protein LTR97_007476 [Elasticomyces elasticus]